MSVTERMGRISVATDLSRVTYLSPILFLCIEVGEKVGKMGSLDEYNKKLKEDAKLRKLEYNKSPHLCKYCGKPILMNEKDKYHDVFKKKFCSLSCTGKYGQLVKPRIPPRKEECKLDKFTDVELISIYNECNSITDLERRLGYKNIGKQKNVHIKFNELGLNISKLKNKNIILKNLTKGDLFKRYKSWQTARSTIQKQARLIYQNSDKPKKCICCSYDKHYEVAHIKAVSDFDDNTLISEINNVNNLIALCPNHHWEYDNTDFDITPFLDEVS